MELINLGVAKDTDENYNSNDYIDDYLIGKNMIVSDEIVFVDGWVFEINRSVPEISEIVGKGEIDDKIVINLGKEINNDYSRATINGKIMSTNELEWVRFGKNSINFSNSGNGNYGISQNVNSNGKITVLVKDKVGKYQIASVLVDDLAEDFDIYNKEDMEKFRDNVNKGMTYEGKQVRLMANIDLEIPSNGTWTPIDGFRGNFLGNNFEIRNLYINKTTKDNVGLFGLAGENSTIKDVIIATGKITSNHVNTGSVVGGSYGKIEHCVNKISVNSSVGAVGGIIGVLGEGGSVVSCINEEGGNVNGGEMVGGIVGGNYGTIRACINKSKVVGSGGHVGGIAGGSCEMLENCGNYGDVTGVFAVRRNTWKTGKGGLSQDVVLVV